MIRKPDLDGPAFFNPRILLQTSEFITDKLFPPFLLSLVSGMVGLRIIQLLLRNAGLVHPLLNTIHNGFNVRINHRDVPEFLTQFPGK